MSVAEMRMLRWMCGKTTKDKTRNANIRNMLEVAPIDDKLRENRLRWYEHVCSRPTDAVIRKSNMIIGSNDIRERGRPKLTLDAVVKNDMIGLNLNEHLALDRAQ